MTSERPPTIDPRAAARWQQLPQPASPWLHEEVARRMQQRLDWITREPQSWVDWEPLRGGLQAHALLAQRYPKARCWVVEPHPSRRALARQALTRPWWQPQRWRGGALAVQAEPPLAEAQMLWANMALHASADPQALLTHWQRALAVDGFLMFSCLGPDTLRELRGVYQAMDWPAPTHDFTDMHDWGDMLLQAGFAEPVMDMERIELSFETPQRLLQELRELGRNLHPGRFAGLRGRGWHARLLAALAGLATQANDGRLRLTFEIIYGHAVKPAPRLGVAGQTAISLDEMRLSLRERKKMKPDF
jgi:malonyl-CoA O-methyltransferase